MGCRQRSSMSEESMQSAAEHQDEDCGTDYVLPEPPRVCHWQAKVKRGRNLHSPLLAVKDDSLRPLFVELDIPDCDGEELPAQPGSLSQDPLAAALKFFHRRLLRDARLTRWMSLTDIPVFQCQLRCLLCRSGSEFEQSWVASCADLLADALVLSLRRVPLG